MRSLKKKTWATAAGLALLASTAGGVALALPEDPAGWYDGDNATVPDPNRSTVPLKLYNSAGTVITSGNTADPIAAFAAADGDVRAGDSFATLFVHLPQTSTTPGAWPGVQVTGTDKFSGTGQIEQTGDLGTKPRVRTTVAGSYSLDDVAAALPQTSTVGTYEDVYELRLRTSSPTAGVSDTYAATWVKVTGTTWATTTAPVLGGEEPPAVNTSVSATWPAKITYGTASSVPVTVTQASGTPKPTGVVRLVNGASVVSTATLSAAGTATLAVPKTALAPGAKTLKVVYPGAAGDFNQSETSKAFTVAKATPSKPTLVITKKPTTKKAGSATITVATPAGLAKAGGKAQIKITKGGTTKVVNVGVKSGKATAKLPKLPAGKWTLVVSYQGDTYYLTSTSKGYTLKVKKPKK